MRPNLRIMVNKPFSDRGESRHAFAVLDLDDPQVGVKTQPAIEKRHCVDQGSRRRHFGEPSPVAQFII